MTARRRSLSEMEVFPSCALLFRHSEKRKDPFPSLGRKGPPERRPSGSKPTIHSKQPNLGRQLPELGRGRRWREKTEERLTDSEGTLNVGRFSHVGSPSLAGAPEPGNTCGIRTVLGLGMGSLYRGGGVTFLGGRGAGLGGGGGRGNARLQGSIKG